MRRVPATVSAASGPACCRRARAGASAPWWLRIRPPPAARALLDALLQRHPGVVLIDAPGANPQAAPLLMALGFRPVSETLRMYRGAAPRLSLEDVYGLACLELG